MAIIAGYAGVGKSYFATHMNNVKEITSMPRSWVLPSEELHGREAEAEKGRLDRVPHPLYPMNMVLDVLKAELEYDYAVIPTSIPLIRNLQSVFKREVIFVYPEINLKEEYKERYLDRGNTENFIELFIDQWEERLEAIQQLKGVHFRLKASEYLSDLKETIFAVKKPAPPDPVEVHDLEERLEQEKQSFAMMFFMNREVYAYPLPSIDDSQDFICKIAESCRKWEILVPFFIRTKLLKPEHDHIVLTEQEFMSVLEKKASVYGLNGDASDM